MSYTIDSRTAMQAAAFVRGSLEPQAQSQALASAMARIVQSGTLTDADKERVIAALRVLTPQEDASEAAQLFLSACETPTTEPDPSEVYDDPGFPEMARPLPDVVVASNNKVSDVNGADVTFSGSPWKAALAYARSRGATNEVTIGVRGDCSSLAQLCINGDLHRSVCMLSLTDSPLSVNIVALSTDAQLPGLRFSSKWGRTKAIRVWGHSKDNPIAVRRAREYETSSISARDAEELRLVDAYATGDENGSYNKGKWWSHSTNIGKLVVDRWSATSAPWERDFYPHYSQEVHIRDSVMGYGSRGDLQCVARTSEVPNASTVYLPKLVRLENCKTSTPAVFQDGGAIYSIWAAERVIFKKCDLVVEDTDLGGFACIWEPRDQPYDTGKQQHVGHVVFDECRADFKNARNPFKFAGVERVEFFNMEAGMVTSDGPFEMTVDSMFAADLGAPEMGPSRIKFHGGVPEGFRIAFFDRETRKPRLATQAELEMMG